EVEQQVGTGPEQELPDIIPYTPRVKKGSVARSEASEGTQAPLRRNRTYPAWFASGGRLCRRPSIGKPWGAYRKDTEPNLARAGSQLFIHRRRHLRAAGRIIKAIS